MSNEKKQGLVHELRIDWSELDYFKHVNNVSIFKYVQSARVNYWDKIGLSQLHLQENIGPMLRSVNCDFQKPLFYPGKISIYTKTQFIKTTSFGFEHLIFDEHNDLAVRANDVMVMYDFNKNEKLPFPEHLRELVEKLEGQTI